MRFCLDILAVEKLEVSCNQCINGKCTGQDQCSCNPGWSGVSCDIGESFFKMDPSQSAGVILTQSSCCLENSFRLHFLDAYGVPGVAKKFDLP